MMPARNVILGKPTSQMRPRRIRTSLQCYCPFTFPKYPHLRRKAWNLFLEFCGGNQQLKALEFLFAAPLPPPCTGCQPKTSSFHSLDSALSLFFSVPLPANTLHFVLLHFYCTFSLPLICLCVCLKGNAWWTIF